MPFSYPCLRPASDIDRPGRRHFARNLLGLGGLWLAAGTEASTVRPLRHGFELRPEHGREGFPFLFHAPSGSWAGQEIQLAVPAARPMPDPLAPARQEPLMHILLFGGLTIEHASVAGGIGNRQLRTLESHGDWYWWWINRPIGDVELRRTQRLGVQVYWPEPQSPPGNRSTPEPMEVFDLPEIDELPPRQWTPWRRASYVIDGVDAKFRAARGNLPSESQATVRIAFPFELRCRTALWETPYRPRKG